MYENRIKSVSNYLEIINLKREIGENLNGKNILVTGGAGAIGSNLIIALSQLVGKIGKIIVLDNLSSIKTNNPWNITPMENIMFVEGDVRNDIDLKKFLKKILISYFIWQLFLLTKILLIIRRFQQM